MKPLRCLSFCTIFSFMAMTVKAQGNTAGILFNPFAKGKNQFTDRQNFVYGHYNYYDGDQKLGSSDQFSLRGDYTRFVADGIGVGGDFFVKTSGSHYATDNLSRSWMVYGALTYGKQFANKLNLYTEWAVGAGSQKDIYKGTTGTQTDKASLFGVKGYIGMPIQLNHSTTFLTPKIGVNFLTTKYDNYKETENNFFAGLKLETYIDCDEMFCCMKKKTDAWAGMYRQGNSSIGYFSKGLLSTGTYKIKYDGTTSSQKDNLTGEHFKVNYNYFIADYLAIGASAGFRNNVRKSDDNDYKSTQTSYTFEPAILYHAPVDNYFSNFYLQVNGVLGADKNKIEFVGTTVDSKYSTTGFAVGFGYDHFFSKRVAFSTYIGYEWLDEKNKETDDKTREKGFYSNAGIKWFFK